MSNDKKLERFGRYLILDHLQDGGMAKICRARFLDEQAEKIVAIKMIQPQFSQDESFKSMFMDEIKVTFGLQHPNIVQTYDYGMHNGQLYVAMEYCDGRNLKEYLEKLRQRKYIFPIEISVYIAIQVCQGLHYAHTLTDKLSGRPANIIHRDISPHNIMLTYDGAIKIIDFGIAKSTNSSDSTQAGTIKGKLSYLAPEYLEGGDLDHRYDMFAVGITLWEMLCSRKLFKAANDLAILKKIQECKITPPSGINPNVTEELDRIVLKTLARNRDERYEDLEELARALNKFLYLNYPDFSSSDLSYFAKDLFSSEISVDRETLYGFGKIDPQPYIEEWRSEKGGGNISNSVPVAVSSPIEIPGNGEKVFELDSTEKSTRRKSTIVPPTRGEVAENDTSIQMKKNRIVLDRTTIPKKSSRKIRVERTHNSIQEMDDKKESGGFVRAIGALVVLGMIGFGGKKYFDLKDKNIQVSLKNTIENLKGIAGSNEKESASSEEIGRSPAGQKIKVLIKGLVNYGPKKQRIYIDDVKVEPDHLGMVEVFSNKGSTIRIETPGIEHQIEKNREFGPGQFNEIEIRDMPRAYFGTLKTTYDCVQGTLHFRLYDEDRVLHLPLGEHEVPIAAGIDDNGESILKEYRAEFLREGSSIKTSVTLKIEQDKSFDLCRVL